MSRLLIKENPVMIIPSLAVKIGLNEAVVLQQIHYWLGISNHQIKGRTWVYNTYEEWRKQLPFWSVSTIKRTILSLEMKGLLQSDNFNEMKMDKTKWYSINYDALQELEDSTNEYPVSPIEDSATEGVGESKKEVSPSVKPNIPIAEIIDYLNEKTGKNFRPGSNKTKELINARYGEGFTLENFKRVIDLKSVEWQSAPKWNKFLRPETLFGTKFESYLNQQEEKKRMMEEDFNFDN
ncbi:conserved phage C-terminal domain-containing protein [Neobacillus sp. CF12]|uniref:conserved phage C-terminal domain-containing protein n=1 Tax=Neobacillus sp. CF12 TaxID=3055864 RepID=UPI0025A0DE93|nr:conserved phage C-terminal domain-containing protein [Neobacillus sp. CF12]MDM5329905.1 conserved phage C-terminal domain-containing protein [Neobacillus sp. CF12]